MSQGRHPHGEPSRDLSLALGPPTCWWWTCLTRNWHSSRVRTTFSFTTLLSVWPTCWRLWKEETPRLGRCHGYGLTDYGLSAEVTMINILLQTNGCWQVVKLCVYGWWMLRRGSKAAFCWWMKTLCPASVILNEYIQRSRPRMHCLLISVIKKRRLRLYRVLFSTVIQSKPHLPKAYLKRKQRHSKVFTTVCTSFHVGNWNASLCNKRFISDSAILQKNIIFQHTCSFYHKVIPKHCLDKRVIIMRSKAGGWRSHSEHKHHGYLLFTALFWQLVLQKPTEELCCLAASFFVSEGKSRGKAEGRRLSEGLQKHVITSMHVCTLSWHAEDSECRIGSNR